MTGPVVNDPKKYVIAARLTREEREAFDRIRGPQSQSDFLRDLIAREIEHREGR